MLAAQYKFSSDIAAIVAKHENQASLGSFKTTTSSPGPP